MCIRYPNVPKNDAGIHLGLYIMPYLGAPRLRPETLWDGLL